MPGLLLESSRRRQWSIRSTLPSVLFHGALIVLAVRATARATEVLRSADPVPHFISMTMPTPEPPASAGGGAHQSSRASRDGASLTPPLPLNIASIIPPIQPHAALDVNVSAIPPGGNDFKGGISGRGNPFGSGGPGGHGPGVGGGGDALGSDQVDRQAYMIPGSVVPIYPEVLRSAAIQGEVVAEFIVDTTGRVERSSIRIRSATNDLFATAVRAALLKGRFVPAESAGQKVRQLVQQPFSFTLK